MYFAYLMYPYKIKTEMKKCRSYFFFSTFYFVYSYFITLLSRAYIV